MSYEEFEKKVEAAISALRQTKPVKIVLVHHDDADGLCSAAVTKAALEREGYGARTFCLEKVYPEVVESLHQGEGQVIFYVDIGSSHADFISERNSSRNLVIILDHHDPMPASDPRVYDLNLEHYGFRGENDFSGATCCYLFAKALSERNKDLSYLALVGSCEIPSGFIGLNKVVLDEAVENGVVRVEGKKTKSVKLGISFGNLFSKLQILGATGYYEGGPELGIKACLEGITDEIRRKIRELEGRRKEANKRILARLYRERLRETDHIQWFDAVDVYRGMGTKVIGQFCSFLSYQRRLIKPNKYILGVMNVQPEVPGWGRLEGGLAKASVRVSRDMKTLIDQGKIPSAVDLLIKASRGFGVADGHKYAANVVIPVDKKEVLIEKAEKVATV
ncbi:MAG: DHH family phosphoesterase [Candidatus Bathyarchaeota archaeon]|nr:DHH family phosphoesterase [Candidatus Bathyarchaeota archaeon]MDH5712674.1 DHH family phosphoesterase [Candidatus Bathyarchaeota archaeon]